VRSEPAAAAWAPLPIAPQICGLAPFLFSFSAANRMHRTRRWRRLRPLRASSPFSPPFFFADKGNGSKLSFLLFPFFPLLLPGYIEFARKVIRDGYVSSGASALLFPSFPPPRTSRTTCLFSLPLSSLFFFGRELENRAQSFSRRPISPPFFFPFPPRDQSLLVVFPPEKEKKGTRVPLVSTWDSVFPFSPSRVEKEMLPLFFSSSSC